MTSRRKVSSCGCEYDNGTWFPCESHMNADKFGLDFGPGDIVHEDAWHGQVESIDELGEVFVIGDDGEQRFFSNGKRLDRCLEFGP